MMDEATVLDMMKRLLSQGDGQVAETVVPDDKAGYPKILCLDMKEWVELGRAHYGLPGGQAFSDALQSVRQAVASRKLVLPITSANLAEASESADPAKRERFARFMVELSGNNSMLFHDAVLEAELYCAVQRLYLKQADCHRLRPLLVRRGVQAAVGKDYRVATGNPGMDALVAEALKQPEVSVEGIIRAGARDAVNEAREWDKYAAQVVDGVRKIDAGKPVAERRRLELQNLFMKGKTAVMLETVLTKHLGVDVGEFRRWLTAGDNVELFGGELPSINVKLTLMLHRDRNPDCQVRPNDLKDLVFLGLAVPYANIVVTENQWGHFVRSSGLDTRYATRVFTKTTDLPDALEAEGCLA